ncbi:acetolactate synthase-1/2/3 large subunit [Saccharothrix saharensis]|uniref:Acetolactate synthase-1/2/3 large subunit n=1 Tax=Saccharothrix saharensis TaxID=571190 RepID=A0A543J7D1_9PSEU|nr:thiamine pyrophosphate-binding protein [Saccharothrix saharensis]TQM78743.1 acetolactate synthase-1/2/3 large subunit [Saccharothrix saharensis]
MIDVEPLSVPLSPGNHVRGAWHAVARLLAEAGVQVVFGLPDDDLHALDALHAAGVRLVVCRDQRNAVFMATGYALRSGALGVALVGKGPAVTNTVTGLLEASSSGAPVLLLSGGTAAERRGSGAFQELDQQAVVAPLVKSATRVEHPDRVAPAVRRAVLVATSGATGPVYVEVPDHLLAVDVPVPPPAPPVERPTSASVAADSAALHVLRNAQRPIVLVGGGMRHRNADGVVERFAERVGAALSCTASGRGVVDESSVRFIGLAGLYAPDRAKALWADADCVVVLGSRLEETATYGWADELGTTVPVVQVNVDAAGVATRYAGPVVLGDGADVCAAWLEQVVDSAPVEWSKRVNEVHHGLRTDHRRELAALAAKPELHVVEVLAALDAELPADRVLVQENGLQDMWSYSFPRFECAHGAGSVVPSEQTSLGFGAAAAIGVRAAAGDRPVVAFVGDGAFALFDADLPTAVALGSGSPGPGLLYVVLRNGGYGWLHSQLGPHNRDLAGTALVDPDAVTAQAPALRGVHQVAVTKGSLRADVADAWRRAQDGGVVVLNVPTRLEDALFADHQLGGAFPTAD